MIDSYSDFTVEGAVRIVQACLAANKSHMIVPALLDRRSAESVEAELAAERGTRPAPAATASTIDALAAAIERRFRTQNRRPGT
jgi:hypothetical protein